MYRVDFKTQRGEMLVEKNKYPNNKPHRGDMLVVLEGKFTYRPDGALLAGVTIFSTNITPLWGFKPRSP